jgi:hypothetical protein
MPKAKLTVGEAKMLQVLSRVVGQALPVSWFQPAQRALVKRMRSRGLLSKRNIVWAVMTEKGKRARP